MKNTRKYMHHAEEIYDMTVKLKKLPKVEKPCEECIVKPMCSSSCKDYYIWVHNDSTREWLISEIAHKKEMDIKLQELSSSQRFSIRT